MENGPRKRGKTDMRKLCILASIILMSITITSSACNIHKTTLQPYEYTATNEIKYVNYYESGRIRDAERTTVMTLEQLGYSDIELKNEEEVESPGIEFILPSDAAQGPDKWYIIDFHFFVEFEESTGGGYCSVIVKPVGSVDLEVTKVDDAPLIRVGGQSVKSTKVDVRYSRYFGLSSIKPGKNLMSFSFKEYQRAKTKKVTIYKDTGISVTTTAPSEYDEEQKVTAEEQGKAREIAFKDKRVQEMVEGKEYSERITKANSPVKPAGVPIDDDIEVRLVFAETYMIEDIEASGLDIFVSLKEGVVTYIFPLDSSGMPGLTESVREKAVHIAMVDINVQKLLEGKEYRVTRTGGCEGGPVGRLGANMDITFDRAYLFQGDFPYFPDEKKYLDMSIEGIEVFVNLQNGTVVQIWPDTVSVVKNGDLR
jgi:hypothetical protein